MISLRQDEFVLGGQPQPIGFAAMRDRDFPGTDEKITALEPVALHRNRTLAVTRGIDSMHGFLVFRMIQS
jgi:hypothetical protein